MKTEDWDKALNEMVGDAMKALDGNELVRRAKNGLCYACGEKPSVGEDGVYCDECDVSDFRKHL